MNKIIKLLTATFIASVPHIGHAQTCSDHGVPINGFPNWQERSMLTWTNAVRMAPTQYRDMFMPGAGNILSPAIYPAVPPLQYNYDLNRSSREHSMEMPVCGLQHNSCDGTTWAERIGSYYRGWSLVGENVAAGFTSPMGAVTGLLADPYNGAPAPDGSGYDGHRWNIMYENYTAVGMGFYSAPGSAYVRYYTQDFGRPLTLTAACSPIVSGTNEIFTWQSTSQFVANYYDPSGTAPQAANVVINGISRPMTVLLGTPSMGTYSFADAIAPSCRSFHFEFRTGAGVFHRYPTRGELRTYSEGGCLETFVAGCPADYNNSGGLTTQDIFDFLNAWFALDTRADFNRSGGLDVPDIFDFLNAWVAGC